MRKYITILVITLVALVTASCNKWLEEEARSEYTLDNYFKNTDELKSGLVGVYASVADFYNSSGLAMTLLGTDEAFTAKLSGAMNPIDTYTFTSSSSIIEAYYKLHFVTVQRANVVLHHAPSVPRLSQANLRQVTAEARFLRAWSYFRLVQTFGRLPLVLEETAEPDFNMRRDSIYKVYDAIIDDLKYAADSLGSERNGGRPSSWTAKTLLAKVYLTIGTSMIRRPQPVDEYRTLPYVPDEMFSRCRELCDDIIVNGGFSLSPRYIDNFMIANKNKTRENIWEIQYSVTDPALSASWAKQFGTTGTGGSNLGENISPQDVSAVAGRSTYSPLPSFFHYYFNPGDMRRMWSLSDWRVNFTGAYATNPVPANISKDYLYGLALNLTNDYKTINIDTYNNDTWLHNSLTYVTTSNVIGVCKYGWGSGDDPAQWYKELLTSSYTLNSTPNNVVALRYADVLLMYAEADMLIGGGTASQTAVDYVNLVVQRSRSDAQGNPRTVAEAQDSVKAYYKVRADDAQRLYNNNSTGINEPYYRDILNTCLNDYDGSRGGTPAYTLVDKDYTPATLTYEELMRQRACEFNFEFTRWFDLARTGTLEAKLKTRKADPTRVPAVDFNAKKHYLFPVPLREMQLARNKDEFTQNPYY